MPSTTTTKLLITTLFATMTAGFANKAQEDNSNDLSKFTDRLNDHTNALRDFQTTFTDLDAEAKNQFRTGSYSADEAADMFNNMGTFLHDANKKLQPSVEKIKKTELSEVEVKNGVNKIEQVLSQSDILNEVIAQMEKPLPPLKKTPTPTGTSEEKLQQRIQNYIAIQKDYVASLQKVKVSLQSKNMKEGISLMFAAGRIAESLEEMEKDLPKALHTKEIKDLQKQIDPLLAFIRLDDKPEPVETRRSGMRQR